MYYKEEKMSIDTLIKWFRDYFEVKKEVTYSLEGMIQRMEWDIGDWENQITGVDDDSLILDNIDELYDKITWLEDYIKISNK